MPMPATTATALLPERAPAPAIDPMAFETCDRCGHRAYVKTLIVDELALSWCAHHHAEHAAALNRVAGMVICKDIRGELTSRPGRP
jgi:hypothetical protein